VREIHLDLLLGRTVRDASGKPIARVQDIEVEDREGEVRVVAYHLGPAAMLARLGGWRPIASIVRAAGVHARAWTIAWDALDISDPRHPRLRGPAVQVRASFQRESRS